MQATKKNPAVVVVDDDDDDDDDVDADVGEKTSAKKAATCANEFQHRRERKKGTDFP